MSRGGAATTPPGVASTDLPFPDTITVADTPKSPMRPEVDSVVSDPPAAPAPPPLHARCEGQSQTTKVQ